MLTHAALVSPPANNPAYPVSTTAWGAEHVFTGTTGFLLQADSTDAKGANFTDTPAIPVGASGSKRFLRALLSDNGAVGHFDFCVGQAANAGDPTRADHVLTVGYNTKPAGGPLDGTEPCFEWRIEDYYNPSGPTGYVEAHWQYYDSTGAGYRPISMQISRAAGAYVTDCPLLLKSNGLSYVAMNGTQYVKFAQGEVLILNGTFVDSYTNNVQFLRQINAAGAAFIALPYVNASDQIQLGAGTPDIRFGKALVALGGGAAPTLGTIGGSGPATAAQNSWMRWIDSAGVAFWVPVWK